MLRCRQFLTIAPFIALLAAVPAVPGQGILQPPKLKAGPAPALTDKNIKAAVKRGVDYLRKERERPRPLLGATDDFMYPVGVQALIGLALLESGVDKDDDLVQQTARLIRSEGAKLKKTYELALAVLFLDRFGAKEDESLIQSCALRLVAAQNRNGGWTYHCSVLSTQQEEQLLTFLRKNQPMPDPLRPAEHAFLVPLGRPATTALASPLPKPGSTLSDPLDKKSDKPLAKSLPKEGPELRKSIPSDEPALRKPVGNEAEPAKSTPPSEKRDDRPTPRTTPDDAIKPAGSPSNKTTVTTPPATAPTGTKVAPVAAKPIKIDPGQWPSVPEFVAREIHKGPQFGMMLNKLEIDDNSNTQFAILALWAARRHNVPMALSLAQLDRRYRTAQLPDGSWPYHHNKNGLAFHYGTMTCVGLLGLGVSHASFREVMELDPKQAFTDPVMKKSIQALGRWLRVPPKEPVDLYFLWSVERTAMVFNLKKIDGQDWFAWGARALLSHQRPDGGWHTNGFFGSQDNIDTAMALLFLCRSHLNRDLTDRLNGFLQLAP